MKSLRLSIDNLHVDPVVDVVVELVEVVALVVVVDVEDEPAVVPAQVMSSVHEYPASNEYSVLLTTSSTLDPDPSFNGKYINSLA